MRLSLRELAEMAETDAGYLSRVERGEREPSGDWLARVNKALGNRLAAGDDAA